jgi:hypothetical protein
VPSPWQLPGRALDDLRTTALAVRELVDLMRELHREVGALREEVAALRADMSSVPFVGRR